MNDSARAVNAVKGASKKWPEGSEETRDNRDPLRLCARTRAAYSALRASRLEPLHQPERAILKLSEHQRRRVNFVFGGELKNNNTDYHRRSVTQNFGDARTIGCACQNFNTKTFRKKIVFNFEKL